MVRYDAFSMPLPSRDRYLQRLGFGDAADLRALPDGGQPTLDTLNALVFAHQTRIPFEALDAHDFGQPACLHIDVLFERIICGRRGGFCFELGALFGQLLREMNFTTAPCIVRNVRGQEDFPPIMHRGEIVELPDARYYADVGYGGPMAACAIPLQEGAQVESCGQRFRMAKASAAEVSPGTDGVALPLEQGNPWWRLDYRTASMDGFAPLMYILDAAAKPQDFDPLSFYCSAHPESVFVQHRLVNLRTPDGSKNIRDYTFTRTTAAGKTVQGIESDADLRDILLREFGIDMPEIEGR